MTAVAPVKTKAPAKMAPNTSEALRRMSKVNPDTAKRYKQRTGE